MNVFFQLIQIYARIVAFSFDFSICRLTCDTANLRQPGMPATGGKIIILRMIARQSNIATRCNMKRILLCCIATCFIHINILKAQVIYQLPPNQPEQDACNALQLCGGSFYTPYCYTGVGKHLDLDETPCFNGPGGGEKNSVWLQVHVFQAGTIVFKLTPVSAADDYDFAVINATGKNCGALTSNDVIRCNYNSNILGSNVNGIIGLSDTSRTPYIQKGKFGNSFCEAVYAKNDEVFLIMINNYGNYVGGGPSKGFTIDFSGSTAVFYNTASPILTSVDIPCNNANNIVVRTSAPVLCSSIAADGSDFTTNAPANIIGASGTNCTARGGYTNSIVINFSSVLPAGTYTINAKQGSDNNTLAGLCNNELLLPSTALPFIVKLNGKAAFDNESICYSQLPYIWNGIRLNGGGDSVATFKTIAAAGCDSTAILNLHVSPPPQQVNISKTICDGDFYFLPWDTTVTTAGTYTHHFTSTNGCDSVIESVILNVIIPRGGTVQQRDSTIQTGFCENGSALLSVNKDFVSYIWNTGQTTNSIIVNIAGTYDLFATDRDGCITIDTFVVARYPTPVAAFQSIENLCIDSSIILDGGSGYSSYLWNNGSTDETITTNTPGIFWVALASTRGCTAIDTVNVITVPRPSGFLGSDITKCSKKEVTLRPTSKFNAYTWSNGDKKESITVSTGGQYWLTVTDDNGCIGKDSIRVIDSTCYSYLYMPNAFSPNYDMHNDIFKPTFSGEIAHYHLSIYNRFGQQIFSTNDPLTGWDGTLKGYQQPIDTYVWICTYSLDGGPIKTERGPVTIIR
jgi:gliding motility-associated-like protein